MSLYLFPTLVPDPTLCLSLCLLPSLCWQAARSYGRRRGNVWRFLWGSVCHASRVSLRSWGRSQCGVTICFSSVLWLNEIIFMLTHSFPCCAFYQHGARVHQIELDKSSFAWWWEEKISVCQFSFLSVLSQCPTYNFLKMKNIAN